MSRANAPTVLLTAVNAAELSPINLHGGENSHE